MRRVVAFIPISASDACAAAQRRHHSQQQQQHLPEFTNPWSASRCVSLAIAWSREGMKEKQRHKAAEEKKAEINDVPVATCLVLLRGFTLLCLRAHAGALGAVVPKLTQSGSRGG